MLVQMRSGTIALMRSLLRQVGYRLAPGSSERVPRRLAQLVLPADLAETIAPLGRTVAQLTSEIAALDARLQTQADADPIVRRLQSVPGVGPVVALTFRAFVDDVARFSSAGQVSAAIGLVPREDSWRSAAIAGHHESRPARAPQPAGAGGVGLLAEQGERDLACLGGAVGRPPRQTDRRGRARPAPQSHLVCAQAGSVDV